MFRVSQIAACCAAVFASQSHAAEVGVQSLPELSVTGTRETVFAVQKLG